MFDIEVCHKESSMVFSIGEPGFSRSEEGWIGQDYEVDFWESGSKMGEEERIGGIIDQEFLNIF